MHRAAARLQRSGRIEARRARDGDAGHLNQAT